MAPYEENSEAFVSRFHIQKMIRRSLYKYPQPACGWPPNTNCAPTQNGHEVNVDCLAELNFALFCFELDRTMTAEFTEAQQTSSFAARLKLNVIEIFVVYLLTDQIVSRVTPYKTNTSFR